MSNDSYDFLAGGAPSAKFENKGDTVGGRIVEEPETSQQTDFTTGELLWWDKEQTQPREQLIVTVQTDLRDPEIPDDDGQRRIFIKGNMRKAVVAAVKATKSKGLDVGGELYVTYVKDGEVKQRGLNPPKLYSAQYTKPSASATFLANDEPAPAAAPAPAPAPTPAPAAGDPLAGLTPEQRAALAALGIAQ